jgi:methionyl-tRNA formyltransferase
LAYKITIITDQSSWLLPYIQDVKAQWQRWGHEVVVCHSKAELLGGDFCFCLSCSELVTQEKRHLYRNTLVVHESDLPRGRGWAPVAWQILAGQKNIPVVLLEAEEAVDSGVIYLTDSITLTGTELHSEWRELQAQATFRLCDQWLSEYPEVLKRFVEQTGEATYFAKRLPKDSELDVNMSLAEQFDLLRVVDNDRYPAFFNHAGKRYKLTIEPMEGDDD